jgi:hypothetical protein
LLYATGVRQSTALRDRRTSIYVQPRSLLRYARNTLRTLPARSARERTRRGKVSTASILEEITMGFGKGALLWLLGIPLPIIILLALFWHH